MKLCINDNNTYIKDVTDTTILKEIDDALSYQVAGCEYSEAYLNGYWDGKKHLYNKRYGMFSTGLLDRVFKVLYENKCIIDIEDTRKKITVTTPIKTNTVLREDQKQWLDTCLKEKRCLVAVATGGGKSFIQVELACMLNRNTIILVNKLDIMEQFKKWFLKRAGIQIGQIGNGVCDPKQITVCMIQTLAIAFQLGKFKDENVDKAKYATIQQTCVNADVLIGDEVHSFVDGAVYNGVVSCFKNASYRIGFSATPYQRLSTELLLEAAFGPIKVKVSCKELIAKGILTTPEVYVVKYKQLRLTGGTSYKQAYSERIAENEERNMLIAKIAYKYWLRNKRIFIAITQLKQGRMLKQMLTELIGDTVQVVFIEGIMNVEKRQAAIDSMEQGKLRLVIGSKCMNEGVNITSMDVLISARSGISQIEYIQTIGRVLRTFPGKKKATIIDIQDYGCKYFGQHSTERLNVITDELEFDVKMLESTQI